MPAGTLHPAQQDALLRVRLLACDVDGVLTDGRLYRGAAGEELRAFHTRDGLGILLAQQAGLQVALVSGKHSPTIAARAAELRVPDVVQGTGDKAAALRTLAARHGLGLSQVGYVGDDLNDLPALAVAGVSFAPADAAPEVAAAAHFILTRPGGRGAVREAVELILKAQGRWQQAIQLFLTHLASNWRG